MAACAVALLAFVGVVGLGAVGTSVAGFSASDTSLDASTAESDALSASDIPASDGGESAEIGAAASNDSDGADDAAAEGSGESYAAGNVLLVVDAALSVNDVQDRLAVEGVSVESVEMVSTELENDETLMLVHYEGEEDAAGLSERLAELDFVSAAQPNYIYTLAEDDESAIQGEADEALLDESASTENLADEADAIDDAEPTSDETDALAETDEAGTQASIASVSTNDPYASKQWEHDSIGISEAWDIAQCDNEVTVAVIDSGVDYDHPDLAANLLLDYAKNCVTNSMGGAAVDDQNGHGTHVAGIIAGVANNATGIAGASYNANILPVSVMSGGGNTASTSCIIKALDYVVSLKQAATTEALANIRVVNLSLGGTENDSSLEAAVQRTDAAGIVVVAAAGNLDSNGGGDYTSYPAAYDNVIAVGNLQQSGSSVALYSGSNKGSFVDISAPGTNIYSTIPSSTYGTKTGTSMASPVVAAVAALVCVADPDAMPDEVEEILTSTALDLGDEGYDTSYGYGEVQADAAVAKAAGVDLGDDSSDESGGGDSEDADGSGDTGDSDSGTGPTASSIAMYRLYNPNSGEHFYTASTVERDSLEAAGWNYEGIGWYAPESSGTPVYRLYNPNVDPATGSGEHHYTISSAERHMLVLEGWRYEGVGWYSDDAEGTPLYRQYNPNAFNCNHNYTTSKSENDWLVSLGWKAEGIAWYGV